MRLPHICVNNIRIFRASRPGTFVGCVIFAIVENALERLHLKPYSLRYADELSGGELQKVIIARALIRYGYMDGAFYILYVHSCDYCPVQTG